ncbi:GNAT family N-acetyltransferase [Cellulomonas fimi]|uniref:GNAT family N-acetyltransferase n=1 Tax=Cellulomonas fimi TaxID=1708 RepID=UPI00234CCE6F|nr:GNAT family N-acetyltransferase [Cellulomonas fimi]MDC7121414.1 GNAT family N-acetyltransferase [Cellulomonas fimi]
MPLSRVGPSEVSQLRDFLTEADLTMAGLDEPTVHLWVDRDPDGAIVGSTGFELSADGRHALIRSVAVAPGRRGSGDGSRLARHALARAAASGADRAWLFSRRSGPFWEKLGFRPADREALAASLPDAHQVRLFVRSGRLDDEVAWSRPLRGEAGDVDPVLVGRTGRAGPG